MQDESEREREREGKRDATGGGEAPGASSSGRKSVAVGGVIRDLAQPNRDG